ncbi:MAG TPA: sugar ABC transporter ATP-binding protein [Pseudolysinimonas sp.]|nr:sugar ABC transporter ATP-binding protein [Pseudolysinimonas sp.]
MSEDARSIHVELDSLSKRYGGVHAAKDVSFVIERGTVHALVGENGAGKSTISKMIGGVIQPTDGHLYVNGVSVSYRAPRQALADGIAMMEQELAMVPSRTVIDNVFLGAEASNLGFVRSREATRRFDELIASTGFELDGSARVETLRIADQQKVEILRALARDAELIIMDEPTASLSMVESEQLLEVIRRLRDQGTTIVYISHFLEEVLSIADTVTVMRDGVHVRTGPAAVETTETLVHGMLGRSLDLTFPEHRASKVSEVPILEVKGLSKAGVFSDISFSLKPGEIVGLSGLIGSGRSEVARAVVGADKADSGEVLIDGAPVNARSPRDSIQHGLVMLPESRQDDGLVMARSVADNVILASLDEVSDLGFLRRGKVRDLTERLMRELNIKAAGTNAPVNSLSGGNQQKVVFAKCLATQPTILIVDEPTRGVDVGAKLAIYELLVELASEGLAVLVISSEIEEILGLAHRVLVMRRGRLVANIPAADATEETVLAAAFGAEASAA